MMLLQSIISHIGRKEKNVNNDHILHVYTSSLSENLEVFTNINDQWPDPLSIEFIGKTPTDTSEDWIWS